MMSAVSWFPFWRMAPFAQQLRQLRAARKITQTRVADLLNVSLDELAGRQEPSGETRIHNPELHRLYKKVDQVSDEDQKALLIVLDSLVKRSRVSKVMAEL